MDSIFDLIFEFASVDNSSQCEDSLSKLKSLLKTEDMPDQCRPHVHKIRLSGWCWSEMNDTGMLRDCFWVREMCQKRDLSADVKTFAEDTSQCMVRIHDRNLQHSSCSRALNLMLDSRALVPTSRECYISKCGFSELGSVSHTDTGQAWSQNSPGDLWSFLVHGLFFLQRLSILSLNSWSLFCNALIYFIAYHRERETCSKICCLV